MSGVEPVPIPSGWQLLNRLRQALREGTPAEKEAALDLIRAAKAEGLAVTCDTAPPYFDLNETAIGDWRSYAKLSPPLRPEADRLAVVAALADGTIDVIASGHDPRAQDEKRLPFADAAPGAAGDGVVTGGGAGVVRAGGVGTAIGVATTVMDLVGRGGAAPVQSHPVSRSAAATTSPATGARNSRTPDPP